MRHNDILQIKIMERILSPSLLSADFGNLDRDVRMLNESEAQWIHIDVMDGVFVPNISFGFPVLEAVKKVTTKFVDTHLMIVEPEKYVQRFAEAGAQMITVHLEATEDIRRCISLIRESGAKAGISIKPGTPVKALYSLLEVIDMVLIMSVEPGFGGQKFMEASVDRIKELRAEITRRGLPVMIEVDGGVSYDNAAMLYGAGCDILVAGSAIFAKADPKEEIHKILNAGK